MRITQFNEPTAGELAKTLDKLEKEGMQALILDLRYNPGGLLSSAVDVSGLFLPPGTKVVSTEGRLPGREYRTTARGGKTRTYPIAVLVNYASASGSEVVAGALKGSESRYHCRRDHLWQRVRAKRDLACPTDLLCA